ncbi:MAG: DUF4962 domain-containing protein [Planctomycetota bacterium]
MTSIVSVLTGLLFVACGASAAEFEAAPAPFQTTPRPADGETVSANPPCFVYPATKGGDAYVVDLSRDASFPAHAVVRLASPYMLAVPPQPLEPGRYFWRWRPGKVDDGADVWSAVRAFTVPPDAPVVPFPDMDALVKRLGASRPRVMVGPDGPDSLRKRALARFGEGWLQAVRKAAEKMRDKAMLPEPALLPDRNDPRRAEVYQATFQATRPFFRDMTTLAANYLLTGDELSGQEAKRRLLHIISWDPRGSTSLSHNDEPATEVIRYCPIVFDRVYSLLTDEERRRCLDCLTIRMGEMRDFWKRRPFEKHPYESHNMGYYLPDALQAGLALVGEAPVEEMLRYTMLQLWSPFYPPMGGDDGGWCEGPSYWSWTSAVVARTYRLVELTAGSPVYRRSNLRKAAFYKLYGNPPYFKMSPFGDGQEGRAIGGETMMMLAALYNNPYAKWYAEHQKVQLTGLDALFFDASAVAPRPPDDLPQGRAFQGVGLAAMHTDLADAADNVSLLFRSSPFGSISHSYADQNTFALFAYGEPLIIASGYYQLYGHPHQVQWTRQTRASNSVLVNGEGQPIREWNAKGRLAVFQATPGGDYAVGDAASAYAGRLDRFDRRILFLRPEHTGGPPVIVIRDELRAPKPSSFQFLLHALSRMEVNAAGQQATIAQGAARCRVDYLAPRGLTFDQHDRFTQPPFKPSPNQWHLTASTAAATAETASLIVIQPCRATETDQLLSGEMEMGNGCIGLVLKGANRRMTILYRTDPRAGDVTVAGLRADGDAASVCLVGDEVRSALLFGGTRLTRGDDVLVSRDSSQP